MHTLTYQLEGIYQEVASTLIPIYTDIFGLEVEITIPLKDEFTTVYGRYEGRTRHDTTKSIITRHLLIAPDSFDFSWMTNQEVGVFPQLRAFTNHDEELPIGGIMTIKRSDLRNLRLRVEHPETIGLSTGIFRKYALAYMEK